MSAINHHLPDEILAAYAAGRTVPAVSLVVACHATLCPRCRDQIADLEALGGAVLAEAEGSPVEDRGFSDSILAQLDAGAAGPDDDGDVAPVDDPAGILPRPLAALTGPYGSIGWKTVLPGVKVFELPLRFGSQPVRLKLAEPGLGVARHAHGGQELDLILTGGLEDLTRKTEYERGDMEVADEDVEHELRILDDGPCLVLSVNEAKMVPVGLRSRAIHFFLGW